MSESTPGNPFNRRRFLAGFAAVMGLTALQACTPAAAPTTAPAPTAAPAPTKAPEAAPTKAPEAAKPTEAPKAAAPTPAPTPAGYTSSGAKGQLSIIYWPDVNGFFRGVIDKFTQETGIGIKYEVAPSGYLVWQQLITTRLASGFTDMDNIHADDFQAAIYGAAGWLEPLDPVIKDFKIDLSDWPKTLVTDVSAWEGKLYRLPWGNDTELWFYRTDFFKDAGVEPPTSWDQLIEVGKKLTKAPDRYALALSAKKGGALGNDIQHWTLQAGGAVNRLDHPGSKQALTFYKDLWKTHKIVPDSAPQDDAQTTGFLNGKFAMFWTWDGFIGALRQNKDFWKDQVSSFLPPKGPVNGKTSTGTWGWSISGLSKKKDLAREWVGFTARPEIMKMQMMRGRVPARISLWSDKDVQSNAPSAVHLEKLAKAGDLVQARPVTPNIQEVYDAAEESVSAYLTDQIDIDTAIKNAMVKIKAAEAKSVKK